MFEVDVKIMMEQQNNTDQHGQKSEAETQVKWLAAHTYRDEVVCP